MKIRMMIYQIARTVSTQAWRILGVMLRGKRDPMRRRRMMMMMTRYSVSS